MKYKHLVVDIDGTLLAKDETVSSEDRDALAEVCRLGIGVSLCTGRVPQACFGVVGQLALDSYHIFSDGAVISSLEQDGEVYVQPLDKEVVKQAVEYIHEHNLDFELYSTTHYFAERETWSTDVHSRFFGVQPEFVDFSGLWERERIIKGLFVAVTPEEVTRIRDFCRHFEGKLHFSWVRVPTYPDVDFINVLAPDVSKGNALEVLVSHLGISMSEVMAVGDGTNDISLLSRVGLAVAMGNAPDEVKMVADYVTLDVDHGGVAAAISRFLV